MPDGLRKTIPVSQKISGISRTSVVIAKYSSNTISTDLAEWIRRHIIDGRFNTG